MAKLYTINELCKLTLVSVRTLHYYDEINLFKPSHRTSKGHRLYSEDDLLRLQQIVTFRFLGFTLSQIQKLLQEDQFNIFKSLKMQANAIAEEAARIEKVSKFFNYLITQHDLHETVDWNTVVNIIEVLKQKDLDTQQWYEKYLTKMELQQFKQFAKTRTQKWGDLFQEIKDNINSDPESDIGVELVRKWVALADEAYGNHPELREKLWEGYKAGVIPQSYFPYDKEVVAYLSKAFEKIK